MTQLLQNFFKKIIQWYTNLRLISKDDKVQYKPFIWKGKILI